jgi:hypothetical protein
VGVVFALLALFAQLSAAMAVPRTPVADAFALALASSICHADDGTSDPGDHAHQHMPDCAVCPVCQGLAQAVVVLPPPGPLVPRPMRVAVAGFAEARVTTWRDSRFTPATARGPPATI